MLVCCLWRNVETFCHKHFVIVSRHQQAASLTTSDVSQLAGPWSGRVVLIIPSRLQRWQHAVKPDIGSESRFLPTPPAFPLKGFPRNTATPFGMEQELSYRKQIARQLRTQYVEGIYDNPVTLKSRLTVSQGHWKRNHWVDRDTRLTRYTRWVIGRWIWSWPWNVGQRSLKDTEISAIRKLGCGFLFAFYSN